MNKTILATLFATFMAFTLPTGVCAEQAIEIVDNDFQQVTITYAGSVLRITGAEGETLQVYNVAGVRVMSVRVDSDDKRFEINLPKGCYIIKVGKFVRKISVK